MTPREQILHGHSRVLTHSIPWSTVLLAAPYRVVLELRPGF
jgi:hypothetical protein